MGAHGAESIDALLQTEIFRELARGEVEELAPALRWIAFARGQLVWGEGDAAIELYVVAKGQLKSYRVNEDGVEIILAMSGSGDVIGEVGLFHRRRVRSVCVGAMEATTCVAIEREALLAFMTRHPQTMRRVLESMSGLAVRSAYSLTDLAFEDIRRRVARTLLDLAREQGEPTAGGVRIRLKLSQATLAAMVAATRENVNRALADFLARGVVSQREGYFVVHQRQALEDVVAREL